MTFSGDRYESFAAPEIALYAARGRRRRAVPAAARRRARLRLGAVRRAPSPQLVERLGVTSVVALQAIPMPVPHTRPVTVTAHATRRQLIEPYPVYWGEMRIPGSVSALLELRLGEAGVDALGVAAHVPHYLAQATYPAAVAHPARAPGAADRPAPAHRDAARGRRGQPHRDRRADRPLAREHRRRRRPRAAVRHLHRGPRGHRPARRRRRGAQRRGDRRGVRAVPRRPGPQAPPRLKKDPCPTARTLAAGPCRGLGLGQRRAVGAGDVEQVAVLLDPRQHVLGREPQRRRVGARRGPRPPRPSRSASTPSRRRGRAASRARPSSWPGCSGSSR